MSGAQDPLYIEFIARLRKARISKRISQVELGESIQKPQTFVSKVETCERRLDLIEAARWCLALGVLLDDVLPPSLRKSIEARGRKKR